MRTAVLVGARIPPLLDVTACAWYGGATMRCVSLFVALTVLSACGGGATPPSSPSGSSPDTSSGAAPSGGTGAAPAGSSAAAPGGSGQGDGAGGSPSMESQREPFMASCMKKVQAPDGMWRQVLDKPELWEETSCTAMFAYGIARAVHRGWIDASNMAVARKAFAGIAKNVTPEGVVKSTCAGTNIGADLQFYIDRPRPDDDMHGRGPVLLAGTELLTAGGK